MSEATQSSHHPFPTVYEWPRFWIPQTGILDLSDAGFLRDPLDSLYGPGPLRTSGPARRPSCAGAAGRARHRKIGDPEAGTSAGFRPAPEQRVRSVYVDLNATSNEDRLYRRIFEVPGGRGLESWRHPALPAPRQPRRGHAADRDGAPSLSPRGYKELPADRLSVRIACRTAVWPAATFGRTLTEHLGRLRSGGVRAGTASTA